MKSRKLARLLSGLLTFCLLFAGPLSASRAQAFPGVQTIAAGAGAGALASLATSALIGAIGLGTAGIGLPVVALLGATIGGVVTTALGNRPGANVGQALGLGTLAAGASASVASLSGFLFSPFLLIPAAALGIGALAWKYFKRPNQWGGPGDTRNTSGFRDPFFSPQTRLANRSRDTAYGDERSFLDRTRSVFDRNRRNDNFMAGAQVNPDGTLYRRNDLMARGMAWINGRSQTGSYNGGFSSYGPGYGNAGYFSPGASPRTDRIGQVTVRGASRSGLGGALGSVNVSVSAPTTSTGLRAAASARDKAYQALLKATSNKTANPAGFEKALAAYRNASQALESAR
jgi:hypothetical protein